MKIFLTMYVRAYTYINMIHKIKKDVYLIGHLKDSAKSQNQLNEYGNGHSEYKTIQITS